ncbi:MAG: hypothetical protein VB035_05390 [Candidatus Fimivivens sp.]|nr:hypothetical protein [Candidatus Fimivivens sp.]
MSYKSTLIINACIFTASQCTIIVGYLKRKKPGKSASNFLAWLIIISFLFYLNYFKLYIPEFIITCFIITVIGHFFLGNYLDLYHKSKVYDRWLHLFGAFSFSLLVFSILNKAVLPFPNSNFYKSFFVITLGISIGTLFEILEFMHDVVSKKKKLPCQHGLADTDYDMIFNFLGSIVAGFMVRLL